MRNSYPQKDAKEIAKKNLETKAGSQQLQQIPGKVPVIGEYSPGPPDEMLKQQTQPVTAVRDWNLSLDRVLAQHSANTSPAPRAWVRTATQPWKLCRLCPLEPELTEARIQRDRGRRVHMF